MPKTIKLRLATNSIRSAVEELKEYQDWMERKADELREEVAKRIQQLAQNGFDTGEIDDDQTYGFSVPNVSVATDTQGNVTVVIAQGEDAVWVEFGAGVWHNGQPGTSRHPKGEELGFTIGSYGLGRGKYDVWSYRDEGGEKHYSMGTPTQMPMQNAYLTVLQDIPTIAREVFNR